MDLSRMKTSHILQKDQVSSIDDGVPVEQNLNMLAKIEASTVELVMIDSQIKQMNNSKLKSLARKFPKLMVESY